MVWMPWGLQGPTSSTTSNSVYPLTMSCSLQCENSALSQTFLKAASSPVQQGGPWGDRTTRPWRWGNKQFSLESRLTPRLPLLKPNTSVWGHQTPGRPATGNGHVTGLGSSPVVNCDGSHVCTMAPLNIYWVSLLSALGHVGEKEPFLMFVSVVGHERFFYDDIKSTNRTRLETTV